MSTKDKIKHGDFTGLASNYSKFRPSYAASVANAILGILNRQVSDVDFVDVGAGTGIWTRLIEEKGVKSVRAVEPNEDMRNTGQNDSSKNIEWMNGSGEDTGLASDSADLLTMASSFHWVDFDQGTKEFHRILKPGGCFAALWNPRFIEANPLLVEIEAQLNHFAPNLKRVSSGRSGITETLLKKLSESPYFSDVSYVEGYHSVRQTPEEYLGVWWSVNDIRAQAGESAFNKFMDYVTDKVEDLPFIETTYQTRAWVAKRE